METEIMTQPISKRELRRLGIGVCIIAFIIVAFPAFWPGGNGLSKAQIGQAQSDTQLSAIGKLILDYRKMHDGKSPEKLSEVVSVNASPNPARLIDGYVLNPSADYLLPSSPSSSVLVSEKPGLWSDGSIAVCFDDLTVKRLTPAEFDALGK